MKFKPLHDRVLVKRLESETKTKSGIIIPETAQEKPMEGTIIAVGTGKVLNDGSVKPLQLKENDIVLFAKWGGTEIKIDNEDYLIMKEEDILGIITK